MNGSLGYSKEALRRLETGTYRGRKQQYRTSEDQVKAVPKPVPALEGMTRSPSFSTESARQKYERRIGHVSPDVEKRNLSNRGYESSRSNFDFSTNNPYGNVALDVDLDALKRRQELTEYNKTHDPDSFVSRWRNWTGTNGGMDDEIFSDANRQKYIDTYGAPMEEVLAAYEQYKNDQENKDREKHWFRTSVEDWKTAPDRALASFAGELSHAAFQDSDLDKIANSDWVQSKVKNVQKKRDVLQRSNKLSDTKKGIAKTASQGSDFLTNVGLASLIGGGAAVADVASGTGAIYEAAPWVRPVLSGILNYGQTAGETRHDLENQGVDTEKARQLANTSGLVSGIAGAVMTGGKVANTAGKSFINKLLTAGAKAGGVGAGSQAVNELANKLVLDNQSTFDTSVKAYMSQGMTEKEAGQKAAVDILKRVGTSGGLGFIVGAGLSALSNTVPSLAKLANKEYDPYSDLNSVWATQEALPQNNRPLLTGSVDNTQALTGNTYNEVPALVDNIYPIQMPGSNGVINLPGETTPIQLSDLAANTAPITNNVTKTVAESIGQNPRLVAKPLTGTALKEANAQIEKNKTQIKALDNEIKILENDPKNKYRGNLKKAITAEIKAKKAKQAELKSANKKIGYEIKGELAPVKESLTAEQSQALFGKNGSVNNGIGFAQMFAGNTPEAQQLAKEAKAAIKKYVNSGTKEDLNNMFRAVQALDNMAKSVNAEYVTGSGNRYTYDGYFDEGANYLEAVQPVYDMYKERSNAVVPSPEQENTISGESLITQLASDSNFMGQFTAQTGLPLGNSVEENKAIIADFLINGGDQTRKIGWRSPEEAEAIRQYILDQIARLQEGKMGHNEFIELGMPEQYLESFGDVNNRMVMTQANAKKIALPPTEEGGVHGLGYESIADIPEKFHNPVSVMGSETQPNSAVIMTGDVDDKNRAVLYPVHMNKLKGDEVVTDIPSGQGRSNAENLHNRSKIYFENKERVDETFRKDGVQFPERRDESDSIFNDSIDQPSQNVNSAESNTGYWLRILGDENFLLEQAEKQNTDPSVLLEWASKNLGYEPSDANTMPPPANNVPHMNGTIPGDGGKTSQTYTNTGKYGGGWSEEQYAQYTDPSQFKYEDIDEQESVNRAIDMRRKEGREGFKNRMMQAQKASGAEIDGMMMEWRDLAAEARALEEAGEDASAVISESIRVFRKIQQLTTESAQGLQALAKWSRNTPEGMLSRAEHIANGRINKDGTDKSVIQKTLEKAAKNKKNFQFDDDFIHDFLAEAERVLELPPDSREADIEMARLGRMVSEQIPVSLGEKVTAFLMNNMLGNFRTLISRNAGGNVGLNAIEQLIQRPLAAGIDSIVSRKTGVRTQAGLTREGLLDYLHGFSKGIKEEVEDYKLDLHTARSGENTLERAISANRHVFKNRLMNFGDKLVKTGLSLGDRPFYEGVYNQTLGDYYRLRNAGKMGDVIQSLSDDDFKMFAEAAAQINALAAVYQKDSQLSNALMGIKNSVGELSRGLVGVDILSQFSMPFVKTPAGVVDVAIDYSPLGLVRNAIKTGREIHNDNFDQNRFANESARNILGTLGMTGAVGAAAAGAMSGGFSDDKDEKQAQKDSGMQEYALNLPGGNQMDIGWSPVTGSNAVAAAAFYDEYKKDPEHPIEGLVKGTAKGGKALLDQAVFQGMQRLFGGDSYNSENGIIGNIGETIKSGFGQGIPALVRQTAQVTDPYKRDLANSNKDWKVLGFDNYDINSLVNNVPVLREMLLAPQVDNSGELVRESQGRNIASKFMEDMILPGKISKFEYNRLNEEAARLKEATTSRDAYMPKASRDNVDTEDHTLTNKEWTEFQQKYYKEMTMAGNKTLNSDFYKNSNAAKQVEILKGVYNAIRYANQAVYNGKELDGAAKKYAEAGGGSKGVDAVVKYYQQGDEAEKLGVNATTYRKKEAEKPGSGKEYAETKKKADALGLSVQTYNSQEKQNPGGAEKYAQTKKSADELGIKPEQYEKVSKAAGNRANEVLNKLPELKRNGITGTNAFLTYEQASRMIPSLTTGDFVKTFNAIDKDNSKGLKQGEVLDYLNANYKNASESEVQKIYDTYILEENRTNDAKQKKIVYKADGVWKDKYPKK